jgi:hypothetical protein
MTFQLSGTPSDVLPGVLATGATDLRMIFVSMSAREPTGRDADYLQWHSLDHRPEQHRLAGLRHSLRVVSTPQCRAARAASSARYDAIDHVMTYFFADDFKCEQFRALSQALVGQRRPFRLPSVESGYFYVAGKLANSAAIAGADVIPWRPALGVYLIVEQGQASPEAMATVEGVAGIWWHHGGPQPTADFPDNSGLQVTYCFLDDDPVVTAKRLQKSLERRWASGGPVPLLAAPFHTLVPFEWDRHLP